MTMDELLKRMSALPPEKQALLIKQLGKKRDTHTSMHITPSVRDGVRFPLSYAQQRLWFLEQLTPGLVMYNVPIALRLSGDLNIRALQQSLDTIAQRHEILRTTFESDGGEPFQVIGSAQSLPIRLVDMRSLPIADREVQARHLMHMDLLQPFNLAQGPLLRALVLWLDTGVSILQIMTHFIACDGWSEGVLLRELTVWYQQFCTRSDTIGGALPTLPIQYIDVAIWQREWLRSTMANSQIAYWRRKLAGVPTLDLPTDYPRPVTASFRGESQEYEYPKTLSGALHALGRREDATLFMTMLSAFLVVLARYSGQDDIAVGTPIANRMQGETEDLIGCFVNTLVLRTDLSGNPTVRALLGRVRETCLEAYAHQDVPFEQVVEAIQPIRDISRPPFFQVMFVHQNTPMSPPVLSGLEIQPLTVASALAKFDLTLSVVEETNALAGKLEYATELFATTTSERLLGHFRSVLESMIIDPDQPIADVPLLTAQEQQQLLVDWNATAMDYPHDCCYHQCFEMQTAHTPDTVAFVCGEVQFSYQHLNQQANVLAHCLIASGLGPDQLVALLMDRGASLLTAILAVFKAGGAYVPLDPLHPAKRLTQVLLQSCCRFVLATAPFLPRLAEAFAEIGPTPSPIVLDITTVLRSTHTAPNPPLRTVPNNLAYVIYTSGSTGAPKGVMVEHRGMINHMYAKIADLHLTATDCIAQTATQCFDISVWQFLSALVLGGQVALFPDEIAFDPVRLLDAVVRYRISILEIVPALLQVLLEHLSTTNAPDQGLVLRWLIATGEALPPDLCRTWLHRYPAIPMLNAYGPTECSDDVTHHMLASMPESAISIPIGCPVANTHIYVLDDHYHPVPIGIRGELYVGGAGVGRGYLGRPDLTAERFVPNPFREASHEHRADAPHSTSLLHTRLYRTGDVARYRADGTIEFCGRLDHQVKVRGFRIELGEIESVLRQHTDVLQAVVIAREDTPGDRRLVAYIVLKTMVPEESTTSANTQTTILTLHSTILAELRTLLQTRLPAYMVPSAFVSLNQLPLTSSGKVDVRHLPPPDQTHYESKRAFIAPQTALETQIARIWEDLLGITPIGINDNFFELGGHSLLAVRLMAQIHKQIGAELPLASLFQGATIAHQATLIQQPLQQLPWSPLVAIQPTGSKPPFFGVHPIGGNVLCYLDLAQALGPDQPFYGLQALDPAEAGEHEVHIEAMASEYIDALQTVQRTGPYLIGGWSFGGLVAFEMAQQLRHRGETVGLLVLFDTHPPATFGKTDRLTDAMALAMLAREDALMAGKSFPVSIDDLHHLDPQTQMDYVLEHIRQTGLKIETERTWVRRFLQGYKARQRAIYEYQPAIYPGSLTLFRSVVHDPEVAKVQALMGTNYSNPTYGWDALCTESVQVYDIPGYHNTLIFDANAEIVARHLHMHLASFPLASR